MGSTFEQIAAMLDGVRDRKRLGVCLDTCHLLASGYDLCSEDGYPAFEEFEDLIGVDRLKVFHVDHLPAAVSCKRRVQKDSPYAAW